MRTGRREWIVFFLVTGGGLSLILLWPQSRPASPAPPALPAVTAPAIPPVLQSIGPAVDSSMTWQDALANQSFPKEVVNQMTIVDVAYKGFDGRVHQGQLVVNKSVRNDVIGVFKEVLAAGEPIGRVIPIVEFGWSDDDSIAHNNSSGFNYRRKIGPGVGHSLSHHSFGKAIDINPYQNPFVAADGATPRPYRPGTPGTIDEDSPVTKAFKRRGWTWGGDWSGGKDYQHFEKP